MTKRKSLTIKERKFVKAYVSGKGKTAAYKEAGYSTSTAKNVNASAAYNVAKRPHIQAAIEEALVKLNYTPEFAVEQIGKVAAQDEELSPKLKASEKILELHGWNKAERPTLQLDIRNAFFNGGRQQDVIESNPED
jgi:phage terminase small subunit